MADEKKHDDELRESEPQVSDEDLDEVTGGGTTFETTRPMSWDNTKSTKLD